MKKITFKMIVCVMLMLAFTNIAMACHDCKEVTIYRDTYGVAHIQAPNIEALFTAWGYTTAQDRLFTLETLRAASQGRVAEMFGPGEGDAFIEFDKLQRMTNVPAWRVLNREIASLPHSYRKLLRAYARGINLWIGKVLKNPDVLLHYSFTYYGITKIRRWTEWDVAQTINWTFGGGWLAGINTETLNLSIYSHLEASFGEEAAQKILNDIIPVNVSDHIPSLPNCSVSSLASVDDRNSQEKVRITITPGIREACQQAQAQSNVKMKVFRQLGIPSKEGSYMFMVGGKKTTGNDTYYFGGPQSDFFYPSRFYETGLHCPGMNVIGISAFGVPTIFNGANEHVAFGLTSNLSNTMDIFILELDGDDYHYIHNGVRKKMGCRRELIRVKGQKAIHFNVYSCVYGPVYAWGEGVAFAQKQSWEGKMLKTFISMIEQMKSRSGDEFQRACREIYTAVNYGYADDQGNFGYVYCGRIPKTNSLVDLRLPTLGTGEYDWRGYHPFNWNPKGSNINRGYIVNWNNIPTVDYEYNDGYLGYWNSFCRVYRMNKLLDKKDKVTFSDAKALIKDIASINLHADYLLPYFEKVFENEKDSRLLNALNLLKTWGKYNVDEDYDGFYDGAGYTIWKAWLEKVFTIAFADELGPYFFLQDHYFIYTPYLPNLVLHHLQGKATAVPIKYEGWLNGATMEQVIRKALSLALDDLATQYPGMSMDTWLTPISPHIFDPGFFPGVPGCPIGVRNLHVYMYRGTSDSIIHFSRGKVADSVNINPPGTSEFVSPDGIPSPHFDDQLDLFEDFTGYKKMYVYLKDAIREAESVEILRFY